MGYLSDALRDMNFRPTGEQSPVDEEGILWSNNHEMVCDETGIVIDGNHHAPKEQDNDAETRAGERVYRYQNSGKVKLCGGYTGSYDWGHDGDRFNY